MNSKSFVEKFTVLLAMLFLLKVVFSQELAYFIHPRFYWMTYTSIIVLAISLLLGLKKDAAASSKSWWSLLVLNIFLIAGLSIDFKPLTSFAQDQKVTSGAELTGINYGRAKRMTSFAANTLQRSLQDWVTIFAINPEPTKYRGQKIKVSGFYHLDADGTPMIARYTMNCCAADARIIAIRLAEKLPNTQNDWVEISGTLSDAESGDERFVQINPEQVTAIPAPSDPYLVD